MIRNIFLLFISFAALSPAVLLAGDDCGGCIKGCAKNNPLDKCLATCKEMRLCKDKNQKVYSEKEETMKTATLDESKMKDMSPEELEKWKKEYQRRQNSWYDKCLKADKDDPYYDDILQKCKDGKENVDSKLKSIEGEIQKKKEDQAQNQRQERCQDSGISDQEYCQLQCGRCAMYGKAWVPQNRLAQRQAEDDKKNAEARAKHSKNKKGKIVVKETVNIDNCPPGDKTCKALKEGLTNMNSGQHQFKEEKSNEEKEMDKLFK